MKVRNLGGHFRCSICNRVSLEEIETNIGDYQKGLTFVNDPKNSDDFICLDCSDVVDEQRHDYWLMDDKNEQY